MDSTIVISSGSDSDDEVPEPTRPYIRTTTDPPWLAGRMDFSRRALSTGNSVPNQASRTGALPHTSRPGDSKQITGADNIVKSRSSNVPGVDYERLSSQQALKRTLPPLFNASPLHSANNISDGRYDDSQRASSTVISHTRAGLTNQASRNGALLDTSRPGDSAKITGTGVDCERLSSQQALKRTLPPYLNPPPLPSRSGNNTNNTGNGSYFGADYSSAAVSAVSNKSTFGDRYGRSHAEIGIHRGINGVRILPPYLTHGTSVSSLHHAGSSDPLHRVGIGEGRNSENSENSERLVYQAVVQDLNQPKTETDLSPGTLSVPLMKHQKIALAWMFQKETKSLHCSGGILADDQGLGKTVSTIALILKQKFESQMKSENSSKQVAEALVLDADDESDKYEKVSTSTRAFRGRKPAGGTLIVCPASVVRQWARELDEKVSEEFKLSVLVYHGNNRTKDPIELAEYDVVVTTYAIVSNEAPLLVDEDENDEKNTEIYGLASRSSNSKKRKAPVGARKKSAKRGRKTADDSDCGTLGRVGWFRIVLDEAQTIKNHRTQVARACCTLRAKRRWCLSGTPIQNTIEDLFSYFRFLRYEPYAVYTSFCNTIKGPISKGNVNGYKKLQVVLRAIMLRRTKGTLLDGKPIINLPPKKVNLSKVDFSVEERSFYKKLEVDSRTQFKAYAAAGTLKQNYANILLMLLRLRQACDHPQLVNGYNSDPVGKVSEEAAKRLPREARISLINRLESSSAICDQCNDPPENPIVTLCGHLFCYQCVSEYITGDENMCPVPGCREQLGHDVVFSKSSLSGDLGCSSAHDKGLDRSVFIKSEFSSSKIKAVLDILQSLSKQDSPNSAQHGQMPSSSQPYDDDVSIVEPISLQSSSPSQGPVKTIVFSQWTGMLDLVEVCFEKNGIEFRRLDGTMSLAARDRAVKEFSNDPDVMVMLMSLKAGNLGLNMVAACHVILLDLWWNPTTEDQAIDRAHRIGQTRAVTVTRMTIKDTVEDRILSLQEEKRKMVASAFGEDDGGSSATRLTLDDLKYLFMV